MANLKEIRTRLASVKSTRQITSAMKMVSAAKLRKAQDAIIQMRPYDKKLNSILSELASSLEKDSIRLAIPREVNRVLIIVITSNKGLCGGFNSNLIKTVVQTINDEYKEYHKNGKLSILAIGRKGAELLKSKGYKADFTDTELIDTPEYASSSELATVLLTDYELGKHDQILLFYNQFRNAANQDITREQFLPIDVKSFIGAKEEDEATVNNFILEPNAEQIIETLVPKVICTKLYRAILDSIASEHGARMTAMHKATDNASELIKNLQLEYNKARQASITNEILEIVGGAEALKG